jgi:hypothetical protein
MKTYVNLWCLAEFFLGWEMFQTKVVEKIKTHILSSITYFTQTVPFLRCVKILYRRTGHR